MSQENQNENVIIEKEITEDGRKKENRIKEENFGEEKHKVLEVYEEIPLKLKTKIIEKSKSFDLVYEKETHIFNSETGEVVDVIIEKIELPALKQEKSCGKRCEVDKKEEKEEKTQEKPAILSVIKNLEEISKEKNKKIIDKVLFLVLFAQLAYVVYYFFIK